MKYFFISFAVLLVSIALMAVGVVFSQRTLKGSCGGLGQVMGEDCMFCDEKDECEKERATKKALAATEILAKLKKF